jgi:hypothetical protein
VNAIFGKSLRQGGWLARCRCVHGSACVLYSMSIKMPALSWNLSHNDCPVFLSHASRIELRTLWGAQVRLLVRGADTVLGDAASDEELFATETLLTRFEALCSPILPFGKHLLLT